MDYKKTEIVLNKYLEGNSTISEEKELKIFFEKNNNIPDKLLFAKDLFQYFNDEKSSQYTKGIKRIKPIAKNKFYFILGIAASFLLAVLLLFSNQNNNDQIIYAYINGEPVTDITIATKQTKQIIHIASQKISSGTLCLNQLGHLMNPDLLIKKQKK
jgi:hypothetical protein